MKSVILENLEEPRGAPIRDYPISVAKEDDKGNYIVNPDTGEFVGTGETTEWSIRPGEKLIFEEYVAKTLADRYHFLNIICEVCKEPFKFTATSLGADSAYKKYLDHKCGKKVSSKGLEEAKNAKDSGIIYCRHCKGEEADKEYKGKVQLAMHIGSRHTNVDL